MEKVQLLSPVGTFEALVAAVQNGADAVYLGSKLFNARRLAGNFSIDELKKAIQYAHLHEVKVFLTLNTLIKNHEITAFLNQVSLAAQYDVDAIILQDLTFTPIIKKYFLNMQIHASTQATIMNTPSVKYWQPPVDVFILARELIKQQVTEIFKKTKAHLEVFVHGHLCISYSGQCLISSLIGKRSGNRGLCASSCRKQYNGDSYLLSAKDLCMINNIKDVIESGAKTIKIEGRMKSAEYVATTTRLYRKQLDAYYNQENVEVTKDKIRDLKLTFNREFTSGYFNYEQKIVDPIIPSKRGIYLGTVRNGELQLQEDLELFDGVSTVYKGKREGDFVKKMLTIDENEINKAKPGTKIKLLVPGFVNGAKVYLLSKHDGRNLLGNKKLMSFSIVVNVKEGSRSEIIIEVNKKKFSYLLSTTATKAIKHPLTDTEIKLQLEKFQSNMFLLESIKVVTDQSFVPKSDFTNFRKELDKILLDFLVPITSEKIKIELPLFKDTTGMEKKIHVKVYSENDALQALNAGADVVCYDALATDVRIVAKVLHGKAEFYLYTPMVITDSDYDQISKIIEEVKPDGIVVNNVGFLSMGFNGKIILGYQMNIFNDNQLDYFGYPAIASIELNRAELNSFANKKNLIYYAHGRPVVMTFTEKFADDQLTDKKGYTFPLRKTKNGATEMLYSKTIALLQHTQKILDAGITQLFLDLEKDVFSTVNFYKKALQGKQVSSLKLRKGVTVGNLEKGVM